MNKKPNNLTPEIEGNIMSPEYLFRKKLEEKLAHCEMMHGIYHREGQALAKGEQAIRYRAFVRELIDFDRIFNGIQDKDNPNFCRSMPDPKGDFGSNDPF